ncbi:DinB family protein [Pontibacter sp. CAU 1760]
MEQDKTVREHLVKLLRSGQAFRPREELLEGVTLQEVSQKVEGLPYTIWQLLEHLRIAQYDIVDFCLNPNYQEIEWPNDYWPSQKAPANQQALDETLHTIAEDLEQMIALVEDGRNDLYAPIPHGSGQTLLREAMLVAEHNAYHLGEIVAARRILGNWK